MKKYPKPKWSFYFYKTGNFVRAQQGDDQAWEQWLWVHKYCDGDVQKAKETWGWVDWETKESTWK